MVKSVLFNIFFIEKNFYSFVKFNSVYEFDSENDIVRFINDIKRIFIYLYFVYEFRFVKFLNFVVFIFKSYFLRLDFVYGYFWLIYLNYDFMSYGLNFGYE